MNFDPSLEIFSIENFGEFGGVNPSIADSSTFTFMKADVMLDTFHGESKGCFLYSRHWNPSTRYLATALARMDGTHEAWVTSSGMAAITNVVFQLCNAGDHIVCCRTIYGGTFAFMKNYLHKFNISVTFVDITNLDAVRSAITPKTQLIFTESINNPLLEVSDIRALAEIADNHGIKLVVDNTFTPMILSPAQLGAHIVVYSITKFLNGMSDMVGGAICGSKKFIEQLIDVNSGTAMLLGPVMDSLRAANVLKNLHTLHIRMKQHSRNAHYIAEQLHGLGMKIRYPGLPSHPQHQLITQMMNTEFGYGGMLVIDVGNHDNAKALMEKMQMEGIGYLAVSLGFFKTLFSCPSSSTSSEVPHDEQLKIGITDGLVRFSVGLDNNIEHTFQIMKKCLEKLHLLPQA